MHTIQIHFWRFYFDRATPAQQRAIRCLLQLGGHRAQKIMFAIIATFGIYQLAVLLALLDLAR